MALELVEFRRLNTLTLGIGIGRGHTPSIAFRHLPPNSARFGYATEGALFIFAAQLSMHRRGQRPPKGWGTDKTVEAA